jgi:hypothetical protein
MSVEALDLFHPIHAGSSKRLDCIEYLYNGGYAMTDARNKLMVETSLPGACHPSGFFYTPLAAPL